MRLGMATCLLMFDNLSALNRSIRERTYVMEMDEFITCGGARSQDILQTTVVALGEEYRSVAHV
jgi:hypothetical protein